MKKSLQILKSFTTKELPILEACLIVAKNGKITFQAHNLDECAEFSTTYEGKEFEACVNMKSLISALGKQNHFELVKNELIVNGTRLPTFPVDHFPCMYEGVPEPMGILPLHEINSSVSWASGTEGISSKLSLQGVHICNKNGRLVVVASDGSRMSVLETDEPTKLPEGHREGYTIPSKAMELLTKIAKSQSSIEYFLIEGKFLEFSVGAFRMMSRPIPEKFPNYKAVIREGIRSMATFNLRDFARAFDKFDEFDRVEMVFGNEKLKLIAYKEYGVALLEEIPCNGMIEGRYMINTFYLGALKHLPFEKISVDYDPSSSWANAVIFHTEGYKYLVMPIRM